MNEFAPYLDETLEGTQEARNYNAWIYGRARPYLGRRVLDLGAGVGTFTELAADDGRDVVALEPYRPYAELLERRLAVRPNVEVVSVTAEALREHSPQAFDAAMCFNVLEHIPDDGSSLRATQDLLTPGGYLLLLVPAHPTLYGEVDRRIGHVRRYNRGPLEDLLRTSGFEPEIVRYVNPVGALGWFITFRLLRRKRWPRKQLKIFNALAPVFRLLDHATLPFGLSVWAVARRPVSLAEAVDAATPGPEQARAPADPRRERPR